MTGIFHGMVFEGDEIVWRQHPTVDTGPGQVRISVRATALNRADLVQRAGLYPPPPGCSNIPGLECSGVVVETGEGVTGLEPGMAVCALLAAGGFASEVVCDARQVLPAPAGFDFIRCAAIMEVFATAWLNLYRIAQLQPGEKLLLRAAGSGVGTAALQLCRQTGNPVVALAGGHAKCEGCRKLGAIQAIDRHDVTDDELQQAGPFDVILDPVSGNTLEQSLSLLAVDGRLLVIGLMGGLEASVNLGQLLVRRQRIIGSTLRSLPVERKAAILQDLYSRVWPWFERGEVAPVIDRVYPLADISQALDYMASNASFGKIVLEYT